MVVAASIGHYQAIAPPALGRKQWIGSWPRLAVDGPAAAARMAKKFDPTRKLADISIGAVSPRVVRYVFGAINVAHCEPAGKWGSSWGGHVFWPTSKTSRRKAYASAMSELAASIAKILSTRGLRISTR